MYDLKQETETTAESLGFGGSATDTQDRKIEVDPTNVKYKNTLNNFGTTFAANSAAFNNLT